MRSQRSEINDHNNMRSTHHEGRQISNRNHDEVDPLPHRLPTLDLCHSTESSLDGIRLEVKKTPEKVERSGIPR